MKRNTVIDFAWKVVEVLRSLTYQIIHGERIQRTWCGVFTRGAGPASWAILVPTWTNLSIAGELRVSLRYGRNLIPGG
ncbi:hypothetical protein Ssi02_60990 [Sinosporangium siamense]|uniref:Uncharacterized protein n=1 Tax=Sinosporangium siamense TaxID=1367973 RepID=A0A919V9X7_9ACTN|nr:hypothetical protein Ssi02_60990 [Sinosporangium siamense]